MTHLIQSPACGKDLRSLGVWQEVPDIDIDIYHGDLGLFLLSHLLLTEFLQVVSAAVLVISDVDASESGGSYNCPEFLLLTTFLQIQLAYLWQDGIPVLSMVCWCWLSLVRSITIILPIYLMITHSADDADTVQTLQIFSIGW